ncbi:S-adenosyl-L-methionine-dependent methyltransferase [Cunninghamella echinulata]|nr:S-adenosyl-L-methionine-dependent methyltransferase [Cunninghamella echinulata]
MTIDWEEKWCTGDILWDEGECSPALVELVENEKTKSLLPTSGCGLVPGCGSGYDVKFLATSSLHMFGLDMSKTCIELCNKKHPNAAELNYEFIQGDFFNFKVPEGGFDLAYDYSFFAALPPYMRSDWANRFSRIIKSDGILICLMYPLEEREIGPPYSVSVESYTEFLSPSFDLIFIKDAIGYECRLGKEKISVWKRK